MANMLPFRNPRPHLRRHRARLPEALAEIMGQAYGVGGTVSDASDNDLRNRLIFEEHWQTLKKAQTTEAFSHSGTQRTIPVKDLEFAYPELALTGASY
ncbi:hypothetical protein OG223_53320 [Streptomyces sp. NBC_01478]|uniref:hypothetical protein n=1 Tax=Streptomyces sp. NBC_01478 TaxID=2903882 RepID=UPI002E373406|nr:hypothetical protein [Streptomyces sp. NBC_01478]